MQQMHHTSNNKTLNFHYALEWAEEARPIIHFIHEFVGAGLALTYYWAALQGNIYTT
jgi:hypothetical protein